METEPDATPEANSSGPNTDRPSREDGSAQPQRFRRPEFSLRDAAASMFGAPLSAAGIRSSMSKRNLGTFGARAAVRGGWVGSPAIPEGGDLSDLHLAFETCESLTELRNAFHVATEGGYACASRPEPSSGRLLLHCIGLNRDLILPSTAGTAAALSRVNQFVTRELIPANPAAVIAEDDDGRIPFTAVLEEWILKRRALRCWQSEVQRKQTKMKQIAKHMVRRLPHRSSASDSSEENLNLEDVLVEEKISARQARVKEERSPDEDDVHDVHDLPPLVEWSLQILSEIIDLSGELGNARLNAPLHHDDPSASTNSWGGGIAIGAVYDELIVEKVASIPNFVEELLIIEDDSARRRVFDLSIVKNVLFCPASLGDGRWLLDMFSSGIREGSHEVASSCAVGGMAEDASRIKAEGAVFYLERISSLNFQDDLHVSHHLRMRPNTSGRLTMANMISSSDIQHFHSKRNELFNMVGKLNGLIRHICVLDDDLVSRAAVTPVIQRVLDREMFSPFARSVGAFDLINHIALVVAFRLGPAPAMFHLSSSDASFRPQQYLFASTILTVSIVYFTTKEIHLALAKANYASSSKRFWSNALSFWNLLDVVPIIMVIFCTVALDCVLRSRSRDAKDDGTIPFYLRVSIAATTPFLWLRILAHIKTRNRELATFVLASVEILKDIKWFLVVLVTVIAAFAQMLVSLTFVPQSVGGSHPDVQYETFSLEKYLKAYTIMLGDLDTAPLQNHPVIVLLFIFYTFGVTIVLLNILIAIVSDSYQNSTVSSKVMLSKARIHFVAKLMSLRAYQQINIEGNAGLFGRRNVNVTALVLGAICTRRFLTTAKATLGRGQTGTQDANSSLFTHRLDLKVTILFCFMLGILFVMKTTMIYTQNGSALMDDRRSVAKTPISRAMDWFVKKVQTMSSGGMDFLSEEDDKKALELTAGSLVGSGHDRTHRELHTALATTKKELKVEMKKATEELRLALQESEQNTQTGMMDLEEKLTLAVASTMAASEERMIRAIMLKLDGGSLSGGSGACSNNSSHDDVESNHLGRHEGLHNEEKNESNDVGIMQNIIHRGVASKRNMFKRV